MNKYSQSTGQWTRDDKFVCRGWAGNHLGKNNPEMENVHCVGPLPQGKYKLRWIDENTANMTDQAHMRKLGTLIAELIPDSSNNMFGRSDFFFHGPSKDLAKYGQESEGCIVAQRLDRLIVKNSLDLDLEVTP